MLPAVRASMARQGGLAPVRGRWHGSAAVCRAGTAADTGSVLHRVFACCGVGSMRAEPGADAARIDNVGP
jgi:hypothetical protein